jgi:hypothetical protein
LLIFCYGRSHPCRTNAKTLVRFRTVPKKHQKSGKDRNAL